jgi:hypothetical protein
MNYQVIFLHTCRHDEEEEEEWKTPWSRDSLEKISVA